MYQENKLSKPLNEIFSGFLLAKFSRNVGRLAAYALVTFEFHVKQKLRKSLQWNIITTIN